MLGSRHHFQNCREEDDEHEAGPDLHLSKSDDEGGVYFVEEGEPVLNVEYREIAEDH